MLRERIVSTFLGMTSLENGNASTIAGGVRNELSRYKLDINNLMGIGKENANVMIGSQVFTLN